MVFVDIISIIIIIGFLFWGLKKGLILEISEIGGLILAFILSVYLPINLNIGGWKYLVSFLVYFLILSIIFTITSKMINKTPLALFDKSLGALVGALKGLIVLIIIFLIISVMPIANQNKTLSKSILYNTTLKIKPVLRSFLERKMNKPTLDKKLRIPERRKGKRVLI
ncbi:MAG: CvpA family protein [Candidatus Stahlbacteria bacterium]|nr:MAG: CvpA family protein [Candidatus Stahlbacteria bacterium]